MFIMENILIIPENRKQASVIKAFLKEMKVNFKTKKDPSKMTKEEFLKKLELSEKQIREGKSTIVKGKEELHDFLESL